MAIAKKDRFTKIGIKILINSKEFPPEKIKYENEELTLLGKSNKNDLYPDISLDDDEIAQASMLGTIGQYVYSSLEGDLFDVLCYKNITNEIFIHSIRTRLQ